MTTFLNKHRYMDAEKAARQILDIDPHFAMAYAVLADIARTKGDLEQAAKYYAFAAQFDARNPVYQRRHEEMLSAMMARYMAPSKMKSEQQAPFALGVGFLLVSFMAAYIVLGNETPVFAEVKLVSSWTLGLVGMLLLSGISIGACLVSAGMLDTFGASRSSAVSRVSPSVALGLIAILNFWLSTVFYLLVGITQDAFNASTSRVMGACVAITLLFACAGWSHTAVMGIQTLIWGGNVVYTGALVGWFVSDSLRRTV